MKLEGRRQSNNVKDANPVEQGYSNSFIGKMATKKNNERWYANDQAVASQRSTGMAKDAGANAMAGAAYRDRTSDRTRSEPLTRGDPWDATVIEKEAMPTTDGVTKDKVK